MPEGRRGKGRNRGYFEKIIQRLGQMWGFGEAGGKGDAKIFHWVVPATENSDILGRGRAQNWIW